MTTGSESLPTLGAGRRRRPRRRHRRPLGRCGRIGHHRHRRRGRRPVGRAPRPRPAAPGTGRTVRPPGPGTATRRRCSTSPPSAPSTWPRSRPTSAPPSWRPPGPLAGALAAALWVVDVVPRTRAALDALFGAGPWPRRRAGAPPLAGGLWAALDDLVRVVPALDALDPVTSELVRLRGARQHNCRLCRSLRSRSALRAGATDDDFAAVDAPRRTAACPPLARAALAFTDAMVWTPGRIDPGVVAALRAEATPGPTGRAGPRRHPQRPQQGGRGPRCRRRPRGGGRRDLRRRTRRLPRLRARARLRSPTTAGPICTDAADAE